MTRGIDRDDLIDSLVNAEFKLSRPRTQEDFCALAARVDLTVAGYPKTERELFRRAWGMAEGLFGVAFERGTEAQRIAWIDMCERAIREQMEGFYGEGGG